MQFDKTTIAIRQRSMLDLVDLSLLVFKTYWRSLLGWSMVGVVPLLLINQWLLSFMLDYELLLTQSLRDADITLLRFRYHFHSMVLVFLEAPLAMLAVTYYLGQAVFVDEPSAAEVWKSLRRDGLKSLWILGILRGGLLGLVASAFIPVSIDFSPGIEIFGIGIGLWLGMGALRAFRPFAPEMIILERSPLRARRGLNDSISYSLRRQQLHTMMSGDLLARMIFISLALLAAWVAMSMVERFMAGVFFGQWQVGWWDDWIWTPVNLWFLALIATIFRFLSYLDTRIRTEGWELKLRLQAEAARLEVSS